MLKLIIFLVSWATPVIQNLNNSGHWLLVITIPNTIELYITLH